MSAEFIEGKAVIGARLPNLKRYRSLFLKGQAASVTRVLQYELLSEKKFQGKTLDFGGGRKASYKNILDVEDYDSINIDPNMEPTWITAVGEAFPCHKEHYDHVLSMNTFEHIYDVLPIIKDIHESLKRGGEFTCALPFLYPVHAHPDDFFRPTASWWLKTLGDAGFQDVKIIPILWGPFTTGMICSGLPGPFRKIRIHFNLLLDLLYCKLRLKNNTNRFEGPIGTQLQNHALGYFIEARK